LATFQQTSPNSTPYSFRKKEVRFRKRPSPLHLSVRQDINTFRWQFTKWSVDVAQVPDIEEPEGPRWVDDGAEKRLVQCGM